MVWPFLMGSTAALLAVSLVLRERAAVWVAGIMLAAYAAVQARKLLFDAPHDLVISAAIWITAGGLVARHNRAAGALLAASGLCYLWARVTDAPRVFGSAPFVASDLLAVAALGMVGRLCYDRGADDDRRTWPMGRAGDRCGIVDRGSDNLAAEKAGAG